jgi:hypothetical protein
VRSSFRGEISSFLKCCVWLLFGGSVFTVPGTSFFNFSFSRRNLLVFEMLCVVAFWGVSFFLYGARNFLFQIFIFEEKSPRFCNVVVAIFL